MADRLPSVFVSHGAPTLALDPGATGAFLRQLGETLPRPGAVLSISAHWGTAEPQVGAAAQPATIHDFSGFPQALYEIRYPAPGAPALGERVRELLGADGIAVAADPARGLDHGAWVPLRLIYPAADVPVVQLSVQPARDASWHHRLGAALRPLREEGVLILASGSAVHNLAELDWTTGAPADWAVAFDEWLAADIAAGGTADLLDWQKAAPQARRAHPSPEHLLPLFVALGAGGPSGERIHRGFTYGSLSMAAYRFDG
jgi:4,5-DOPA dioxygenase extradiol